MFKKLFEKAVTGSYDISFCGYNEYYNDTGKTKPVKDVLDLPYSAGVVDRVNIDFLIPFQRIGIWRAIYKKSFLENNKISFDSSLRRFDDLPFKVLTYLKADSVISVPEHLYYYRLAREGQDVSANDKRLYVHFDIFKKLDESFASNVTDEQLDYYHIVKIHTHLWALSKLKKEFIKEYKELAKHDLLALYSKEKIFDAVERYCSRKLLKKAKKLLR